MPLTIRYVFVKRGGDNGGADVACTAADECRLGDLIQSVSVLEVLQTTKGLILIGPPTIEVGFCAGTFRTFDALR